MTEADWLAATDPQPMLEFFAGTGWHNVRKLRLFACACARRIWSKLSDKRSQKVIETAERFVDGRATLDELSDAATQSLRVEYVTDPYRPFDWLRRLLTFRNPIRRPGEFVQGFLLASVPQSLVFCVVTDSDTIVSDTCALAKFVSLFDEPNAGSQANILRDIVGNLFHPGPTIDPAWLASNGGVASNIAKNIYDERCFDRLPLLADALEDAGCSDAELLGHLRGPGPHWRGCWALDLILSKDR